MEDKCPHCGAGSDRKEKTHYTCGWPKKPYNYLDPQKFHEREKAIAEGRPWD